ncbi:hypothetical protein lerEdw1_003862 [Lerista edwardsae]|nr:hypothetical protein lerEdw1_003862 [Lerista edwardsae]
MSNPSGKRASPASRADPESFLCLQWQKNSASSPQVAVGLLSTCKLGYVQPLVENIDIGQMGPQDLQLEEEAERKR